jgi:flagellar basal-body rod protein FlgB
MDGMSLLSVMTQKMRWHQQRQDLLSQNVANADTPNYRGQELKQIDFGSELDNLQMDPGSTSSNDPRGFSLGGEDGDVGEAMTQPNFEVTPEGNGITIEDEMMKVASNQMDYQAVTTLYSKSLQLIRTAIGR